MIFFRCRRNLLLFPASTKQLNKKETIMTTVFIAIGILVVINFLLLQFSCNEGKDPEEAEE